MTEALEPLRPEVSPAAGPATRVGPNLFVAGAPKCGTTSIHRYLFQHPEIFMTDSRHKEPQFWIYEGARPTWKGPGDDWMNNRIVTDRAEYFGLFDDAGEFRFRGESSPYYLANPIALDRILGEIAEPRFILMLRDPVKRAESLWRHLWAQGRETEKSVLAAMARDDERARLGWEPFWQYRETGLYGAQLERMYSLVRREHVKIVYYDDFASDPQRVLSDVFGWLGVLRDAPIDTASRFSETKRAADTRRNRTIQVAVSRKSAVKRLVPQSVRAPIGGWLLRRITNAPDGSSPTGSERVDKVAAPEVREAFRADIELLQQIVGDVPTSWFG